MPFDPHHRYPLWLLLYRSDHVDDHLKNSFHVFNVFFLHKVTSLYVFITAVGIMAYYLRYCYSLITNTFIINIFPPWVILSYILPTCVRISFLLLLPPVRSLISFSRCQGQSLTSAEYLLRRWKRSFARKVPQNCKQSRPEFRPSISIPAVRLGGCSARPSPLPRTRFNQNRECCTLGGKCLLDSECNLLRAGVSNLFFLRPSCRRVAASKSRRQTNL